MTTYSKRAQRWVGDDGEPKWAVIADEGTLLETVVAEGISADRIDWMIEQLSGKELPQ